MQAESASSAQPQSAAPASDSGVSTLVSRFVSRTVFPATPAPLVSGEALLKCAPSELAMVLAIGASKSSLTSGLAMLKAAFDTGACLALAHDEAAQHKAEEDCGARGGRVTGIEGNKIVCEVRETVK
ncbi:MAG TPA: hypothetical protein VFK05_18305 [Polyangiaceae bacterium]|nr:hypothetical protein [Polyangiaceae bacterium]